jgi:alpha-ketoglutaric semialdehyde dehydrogenase
MSSINPVIFLPEALTERPEQLATELVDSVLAGSGQFCTSPNLVLAYETPENKSQTESFLNQIAKSFSERPAQPLLSSAGRKQLHQGVTALTTAGAQLVTGGDNAPGEGYRYANTLLRATAAQFLAAPHDLQREIFGNATLAVTVNTQQELQSILHLLEGNLTGTIYSAKSGADDESYNTIAPLLREKVGRLLNDKMPTGVAVSPAMNHGGPYPSTSHPGSTSVGIPTSIARFAKLDCYDSVRPERLPAILKDTIANPNTWRSINGAWIKG